VIATVLSLQTKEIEAVETCEISIKGHEANAAGDGKGSAVGIVPDAGRDHIADGPAGEECIPALRFL